MSYSNNPRSILAGTGITVTPATATGANTVTIATSGVQLLNVRIATITPVAVLVTDNVVITDLLVAAPVAVTLPVGVTGQVFEIKDGKGDAGINAVTITPAAGTIDGAATATINTNYGAVTLIYNGTQWNII